MSTRMHMDPGFWVELSGKVGPPIVAGTLVAWLLSGTFGLGHGILIAVGLVLIGLSHRHTYHKNKP